MRPELSDRAVGRWWMVLTAGLVLGCGDDGSGPDLTQVASLTVIPSDVELDAIGATQELTATARDALGNELSEAAVTWESSDELVATVDASGVVTSVGRGTAVISAMAGSLTRTSGVSVVQVAAALDKVSGDQQAATVTTGLGAPLVVQVNDRLGSPVEDITIRFSVRNGPGTLSVTEQTTGTDGRAATDLTLGTLAGPNYSVAATATTGTAREALFTAIGLADVPAGAAGESGDGQRQPAGVTLPMPLAVLVTDQYANGVPDVMVSFTVTSGGGSVSPANPVTDETGVARTTWTLGATIGPQSVDVNVASVGGPPVAFTAEGTDLAIATITPATLVEGQTAQITGTGFEPVEGDNTVLVDGVPALVTGATTTTLDIVVPLASCLPARDVDVAVTTDPGGTTPPTPHPLAPGSPVALPVGQQVIIDDPSLFCLQFLGSAADEEYLVGVQSLSTVATSLTDVTLAGVTASGGPAPSRSLLRQPTRRAVSWRWTPRHERWARHRATEAQLREQQEAVLASVPRSTPRGAGLRSGALIDSNVTVGQQVTVRVPDITTNICTGFSQRTAVVKAVGQRGIWLDDTGNPGSGFTDNDYQTLSDQFDDDIYDINVANFGELTDLDENARVLVLVSTRVNEMSPATGGFTLGFVSPIDLLSRAGSGCSASNEAEIFYMRAPSQLESPVWNREAAFADGPVLVAHEVTHIIQEGRRLVIADNPTMSAFMKEGQATLAEELAGFNALTLAPGQDLGFATAFNNPQTVPNNWFEFGFTDIAFYFGLNNTDPAVSVPGAPARCGWLGNSGAPCQGRSLWYGVTYSLLRWLNDQFGAGFPGGEADIQRALIDNDVNGFANIADVIGEPIGTLLAQWSAALYLDGRVGGLDPRLTMPSWDMFDIYEGGGLPASASLTPGSLAFDAFSVMTRVRAGSTAHFVLSGTGRPATSIRFRDGGDGELPAHMQIYLVRTR